jgi:hypothetical protein
MEKKYRLRLYNTLFENFKTILIERPMDAIEIVKGKDRWAVAHVYNDKNELKMTFHRADGLVVESY